MPINRKYHLDELMKACRHYFAATGRRISFEYSLIEGVNDTEQAAQELINLLGGMTCHVNLIPINEIRERDFRKSRSVERFPEAALRRGDKRDGAPHPRRGHQRGVRSAQARRRNERSAGRISAENRR